MMMINYWHSYCLRVHNEISMIMRKLRIFLVMLVGLFVFASCQKDNPIPSPGTPSAATKTMDAMVVKPTFDWKTSVQYKLTLKSKSDNSVILVTPSGSVNQKFYLIANSPLTAVLSAPSYEKTIHLLFNKHDVEISLSGPTLSYTFNY